MNPEELTDNTPKSNDIPKTLAKHLTELRKRLLWSFLAIGIGMLVCFLFAQEIYGFLVTPLAEAMSEASTGRLIYTGLAEAFFTYLKVAFFAGAFLTTPVLLFQVWLFISPGLYGGERGAVMPFLIASPILFFCGGAMVYYVVMPSAWPFFLSFESTAAQTVLPVQLEARVSEYLSLVMTLIFAFGLCFQLPVLMGLLGKAGLISADALRSKRKYALVLAFIVAAFLTPPDVVSQILLAMPIMVLYEASIFIVARVGRNLPKEDK